MGRRVAEGILTATSRPAKHLVVPFGILVLVTLAYIRISGGFFCAFDDFHQLHRAVVEDMRAPARMFTTGHFGSFKYRPIERGLNVVSAWAGGNRPEVFRLRNLGFHLANVLLIFGLAKRLFRSSEVAAWAACLFGVHPVASVTVDGALWGNTFAHAAALAALMFFVAAIEEPRYRWLRLVMSLIAAGVGMMAYDSNVVIFGLMAVYLFLYARARREPRPERRHWLAFAVLSATMLVSYMLLRASFIQQGWAEAERRLTSAGTMARNLVMYSVSLASPVDPVLANTLLDTPLPSEIRMGPAQAALGGALLLLVLAALVGLVRYRMRRRPIGAQDFAGWPTGFLLLCVAAPLAPVVLLEPHPSETYLYLSVAFFLPLLVGGLHRLVVGMEGGPRRRAFRAIVLTLLLLFTSATLVRNERVRRCGETAQRLLSQIPGDRLGQGAWTLWFANVPGEERSRKYGCYGFRGTDTIGDGTNADIGMTAALQVRFSNESLSGRVLEADEFSRRCSEPRPLDQVCLWVHADGRVREWRLGSVP